MKRTILQDRFSLGVSINALRSVFAGTWAAAVLARHSSGLQQPCQLSPRAMNEHANTDLAYAHDPRGLRDRKPLAITEPERLVLRWFEPFCHRPKRRLFVGLFEKHCGRSMIHFLRGLGNDLAPSGAEMIQSGSFGNGKQPRCKRARAVKSMHRLIGL